MLEQLAPAANPLPLQGRRLECRVYRRLPCDLPGSCKPASDLGCEEARWSATARDISQGGVRLLLSRRYEPGSGLAIELPAKGGQELCTFLAKVIHVRAEPEGSWTHGCQFVSPLSQDELQRLLGTDLSDGFFPEDQPQAMPGPNVPFAVGTGVPSAAAKVPGHKTAVAQVRFQLVAFQGTLVDCLIKRLSVPPSWPLAAGKTVTIRGGAADETPWSLRVQVSQCSQQGERWTLRCRLLHPPAPADLLRALAQHEIPNPKS